MELQAAIREKMIEVNAVDAVRDGVFAFVLSRRVWPLGVAHAWPCLDATERARVERKLRSDDRDCTALAYACHRLVLATILDCAPADVPLSRDARGRPCLVGEILQTSVSHADPFIAIAVSASGRIGIDVEPATRAGGILEIAEAVCHPAELAAMMDASSTTRAHELLRLWVRKEALLKAAGVGLMHEMKAFQAPADAPLALPGEHSAERVRIRMLDEAGFDGCVCAVAGPIDRPVASIAVT